MSKNEEIIYEFDTRNRKDGYVTKYFDKHGIKWIRNKLYAGDVKLLNDTRVIIDLKANIEEIAHNLCNSKEHLRIRKELEKAKEIKCEEFIFLIKSNIKSIDDLINWTSTKTKVRGSVLVKVMATMRKRYGCRFIFTTRANAPKRIIELLNKKEEV